MPSLPPVSQKLIADAEQFIAEFKRAERAASGTGSKVDAEMTKLARSLEKKFSLGDIGKDILKFAGIGSGFAVAEKAVGLVTDYFERQKQLSSDIETIWNRIGEVQLRMRDAGETDLEKRLRLEKEIAKATAEYADKSVAASFFTTAARGGAMSLTPQKIDKETEKKLAEMVLKIQQLREEYEKLTRSEEKRISSERVALEEKLARALTEQYEATEKQFQAISRAGEKENAKAAEEALEREKARAHAMQDRTAATEKFNAQMSDLISKYREIANPAEKFEKMQEEIRDAFLFGGMGPEAATEAMKAVDKLRDDELAKNKSDLDEFSREWAVMWSTVSDRAGQAFADMVLTGENAFKKLPEIVARSILEITARLAVINPILNFVFGQTKGWSPLPTFYGGGKASGGPVNAGGLYRVNEAGPEMLSVGGMDYLMMGNRGGSVTSNNELRSSGGNTYIIDARGTDESVVQRLAVALQALAGPGVVERRAIAAVSNSNLRIP